MNFFSNSLRRALLGSVSASVLMAGVVFPLHAQDELIIVEPVRATMYLNGGIGTDEQQYMREVAKDWSLRMIFSENKNNEFVADVSVVITNPHGTPYLLLSNAGPMTYVMLPAGKYRITANFKGLSETREITLNDKIGRDVYFHWKEPGK
ncbi:MAG: hypothetical protein ABI284_03475 [Nitrosospira sp.]